MSAVPQTVVLLQLEVGQEQGLLQERILPRLQALKGDAVTEQDSPSLQGYFLRAGTLVWPKDGLPCSGN